MMIVSPFHLGDLVLIQTWCPKSDTYWTSSTVCMPVFFNLINMVTMYRHTKLNYWFYLLMTGLFITLVLSWVL